MGQPARPAPPPPTRRTRAFHLLTLSDDVLMAFTCLPNVQQALQPFTSQHASQTAYDAAAFVYGFGVDGPSPGRWRALFAAADGLRGEEIAICVGITVIGGLHGKEKRTLLEEVVMGADDVPGILDKVCESFDDWLVSADALMGPVGMEAETVAAGWWLERISDGRFVWMCEVGNGSGVYEEHALGDAVAACARRIGVQVTKRLVERAMRRISWEGVGAALGRVRERAELLADGGKCKAEAILINRVFEVLGVRPPEHRGF